ncbi:MAG: hypothetical protein KZQ93_05605 [Candidatus Thiodiazotropha sp. (ex Monitilora ramsayi)]|nr:hypothetical protein [Candidatus Thiodiazotropha sp. (ex Monitilora ramsayi)]
MSKVSYLFLFPFILFYSGYVSADAGISSLGSLVIPFYILVVLSSLIGASFVFLLYKKYRKKWQWWVLPIIVFLSAVLITVIYFFSIYLLEKL